MLSELQMQPEWVPALVLRQPAYTTRPSAAAFEDGVPKE